VAPGADPKVIRFKIDAQDSEGKSEQPRLSDGDLVLGRAADEIRFRKPIVYQPAIHGKHFIEARYALKNNDEISFEVAAYDHRRPLIIDPGVLYSTYLGSTGADYGQAIAVDGSGNAYIAGYTSSVRFTHSTGALQGTNHGGTDAFVVKLSAAGSRVYATYLGGSARDQANAIALDASGSAYVTGYTQSTDFPTANPLQPTNHSGDNAFVAKLNASGSALVYSTYLGGSTGEWATAIAVDTGGNAYVTGRTLSTDFPTVNPLQPTNHGSAGNTFVSKLNESGSAFVYSTYLGGSYLDQANAIAVDGSGNAYIAGIADSPDFPTVNPFQATNHGYGDIFVSKLNESGSALVYSTYLGGSTYDEAYGIAVDTGGNAYVSGWSQSTDFPIANALQPTNHGGPNETNAVVAKLSASGSSLVYSTYLGGSVQDGASAIAVDGSGNAYITGGANSPDFPTADPLMSQYQGGGDAFVSKLNASGSALVYSTYLGGTNVDSGSSIAIDSSGNAYVTGVTGSTDFPTADPFQPNYHGHIDAFVVKIVAAAPAADLQITNSAPSTVTSGSTLTYTITVTNLGPDPSVKLTITDLFPKDTTFNNVAISSGTCTAGLRGTTCKVPNLANGDTVTETLTVNVTAGVGHTLNDKATVTSRTFDSDERNNAAIATTSVM
jgi:uncharacterized repeat protein (TIGR01451 family)